MKRWFLLAFCASALVGLVIANEEDIAPLKFTQASLIATLPSPYGQTVVKVDAPLTSGASLGSLVLATEHQKEISVPKGVLSLFPSPQISTLQLLYGPTHSGKTSLYIRYLFGSPDRQSRYPQASIRIQDFEVQDATSKNSDGIWDEAVLSLKKLGDTH